MKFGKNWSLCAVTTSIPRKNIKPVTNCDLRLLMVFFMKLLLSLTRAITKDKKQPACNQQKTQLKGLFNFIEAQPPPYSGSTGKTG